MKTITQRLERRARVLQSEVRIQKLITKLLKLHHSGVGILLDVDQTVYDKGQWDIEFLHTLQKNGIPIVFATHGGTIYSDTKRGRTAEVPVAYATAEVDTVHAYEDVVCEDGSIHKSIVLDDMGMPLLLKVVPEGCVLVDNMAKHYNSERVIEKLYIAPERRKVERV